MIFTNCKYNQNYKEAKQEAERLTGLTLPDINKYKDNGYTVDNNIKKTGYIWRVY